MYDQLVSRIFFSLAAFENPVNNIVKVLKLFYFCQTFLDFMRCLKHVENQLASVY